MTNDENVKIVEERPSSGGHTGMFAFLTIGLAVALVGDGVLLSRSSHMRDDMAQNQDGTQQQIAKLGDATTSLLEQRLKTIDEEILTQGKEAQTSASNALRQARAQVQKQGDEWSAKLQDQQQQVSSQIADLKSATSEADNKIAAVSTDVDGVKTDVTGVKTDVASTKDGLDKTSADLKRAMGDMGVMSGLIATNSKDLQALRELGDRNYIEFDLNKLQSQKKIGDVTLTLKKSDPKHNRFTVAVSADDKLVEKKRPDH
jgi:chromosome segregation ATPase